MYEIMNADEAIRLIRDGDCICVNSFVGIENPMELHEALRIFLFQEEGGCLLQKKWIRWIQMKKSLR